MASLMFDLQLVFLASDDMVIFTPLWSFYYIQ